MNYAQYTLTKGATILAICIAGSFELGQIGVNKAIEVEHAYHERYCYKPIPQIDEVIFHLADIAITRNYAYGCLTMVCITIICISIYIVYKTL